jgi:hypothetical protein
VIGDPPSEAGALNVSDACPEEPSAATFCGAPGVVAGVTVLEGADAGPTPAALVAVTVKVYGVPLLRPLTMIGEPFPVAVMPPATRSPYTTAPACRRRTRGARSSPSPARCRAWPSTACGSRGGAAGPDEPAQAPGPNPTGIVATTVLSLVRTTDTSSLFSLAT